VKRDREGEGGKDKANLDGPGYVIHHSKGNLNRFRMVYDTSESAQNCVRNMRMTVGE